MSDLDEMGVRYKYRFISYFDSFVEAGCPNPVIIECDRNSITGRSVHKWQDIGYIEIKAETERKKTRESIGGIREMRYDVEVTELGILMLEMDVL